MSTYHIQHRVKTLAELYEKFEFRGYLIGPWNYDPISGTSGGAWLCEKRVDAETVNDAFRNFMEGLRPVVDRVAFVSQCYTSVDFEPFRILKENNNEDKICYVYSSEEEGPVPLMFLDDEIQALHELEKYQERGDVFRYLREAGLSASAYPRFSMLMSALEAMAGEFTDERGNQRTNKDYIRDEILKDDELTGALYRHGSGVRNVLLHGKRVQPETMHTEDGAVITRIYAAILRYFKEKHGANIDESVVHPLRHPLMNYRGWRGWIRPRTENVDMSLISIQHSFFREDVEQIFDEKSFQEQFDILDSAPENY